MGPTHISRHYMALARGLTILIGLAGYAPPTQPETRKAETAACTPPLRDDDHAILERETRGYFPEEWTSLGMQCRKSCLPLFSPFQREWYSSALAAAEEPSLAMTPSTDPGESQQFRFTWLPTFHHPVMVRVTFDATGGILDAVELTGAGGYSPGKIGRKIHRTLRPEELSKIRQASGDATLFEFEEESCDQIHLDGSEWLFEKRNSEGYHFGNYWAPRGNTARQTGKFMLNLTGWQFAEIY